MKLAEILAIVFPSLFSVTIILIAIVIVLENRNPSKTVTWLMVLYLLPVVGFIFYIFFGRNFRRRSRVKAKENNHLADEIDAIVEMQRDIILQKEIFSEEENIVKRRLVKLLLNNSQSPFSLDNETEILTNGHEKFRAVFQALRSAQDHIHVEYFIIKNDKLGRALLRVLTEKARQGVKVRLIYDGVGSWKVDFGREFFADLIEAGADVRCFVPIKVPFLNSKINYRNHRKILVVDGEIGFVGGINVGDEYIGMSPRFGFWRDTHIRFRGDAVYALQKIFLEDWFFVSGEEELDRRYFPDHSITGDNLVQIAASGPDSDWNSIMQLYYAAMASAQERIHIISPYFIPDESILMALKTAALSGVDVKLIIPDEPDHHIVYWATHSYLGEMMEAGVQVYKYTLGFIHAKVLIVDGAIASVGTANMDIRSFQLNYEVNAFMYDAATADRLERDFAQDLSDSIRFSLEDYNSRSILKRAKESGARLLSPLM